MPRPHVCVLCARQFDPVRDVGSLGCWFHPKRLDENTRHYPCCGATDTPNDHTHRELNSPPGCHRVDHVESIDELLDVLMFPYKLVPVDESKEIFALRDNSSRRALHTLIDDQNLLSRNYTIVGPCGKTRTIDLFDAYEKIKRADSEKRLQHTVSSDYYVYPSMSGKDTLSIKARTSKDDQNFVGFFIIRRAGSSKDADRMRSVRANDPCEWEP